MAGWVFCSKRTAAGAAGLGAAAVLALAAPVEGQYPAPAAAGPNPCVGERAALLLCPDLLMARPSDLYTTYGGGKVLLHATNDIRSRGEGPLEIRGKRIRKRRMSVRQAIRTTRGKYNLYDTNARLVFYNIPGQGPYWKFHFAALFQIWSLDGNGNRAELVRKGPKVNYCFRDLVHTDPGRRSPANRKYPGCSQVGSLKRRTLGTSVGWSDVYPSTYYQNWINVKGLRGCFQFAMTADPQNHLFENDEQNNTGSRRVLLPPRGGRIRSC